MNRWILSVILLLAISASSFAQYTARDSLQNAINRALTVSSDNQLYWIETGGTVTTSGTSSGWVYVFHSASRGVNTSVILISGFMFVNSNDTSTHLQASMHQIPSTFVNSSTAMSVAEANGGSAFRASNPTATITLTGAAFGIYAPDPTRNTWVVIYNVSGGATLYVLVDMATGNFLSAVGVSENSTVALPRNVELNQNYPNPFNPTTSISFSLPTQSNVKLDVFDMMGREVTSVASGEMNPGMHEVHFDGSKLASGEYIYRLNANGKVYVRRMTLLK